jgi:hypothetical protein
MGSDPSELAEQRLGRLQARLARKRIDSSRRAAPEPDPFLTLARVATVALGLVLVYLDLTLALVLALVYLISRCVLS